MRVRRFHDRSSTPCCFTTLAPTMTVTMSATVTCSTMAATGATTGGRRGGRLSIRTKSAALPTSREPQTSQAPIRGSHLASGNALHPRFARRSCPARPTLAGRGTELVLDLPVGRSERLGRGHAEGDSTVAGGEVGRCDAPRIGESAVGRGEGWSFLVMATRSRSTKRPALPRR